MESLAVTGEETVNIESEIRQQAQRLAKHCAGYKGAVTTHSVAQFILDLQLFALLSAGAVLSAAYGYWVGLLLVVPAAGMLVRLFIIQHDCGHRSFYKSRIANDAFGRFISILTFTPYDYWRKAHAIHHETSGNLCRRGVGDISIVTVREYLEMPLHRRIAYRLYRHPCVLHLLGPPYHFFINQRIPFGVSDSVGRSWPSILSLNFAIVVVYGLAIVAVGWKPIVIGYVPIIVLASCMGGWLFYIQHQFEGTYWDNNENWDFHVAALIGSSYYDLPRILQWFTGNIGLHHIHHLCGSIPNYRLQDCLDASPELQKIGRITLSESLKFAWLALWDEEQRELIGFNRV
jgi:omega-6 fatty acid desaturase (delta-12 desaturase)